MDYKANFTLPPLKPKLFLPRIQKTNDSACLFKLQIKSIQVDFWKTSQGRKKKYMRNLKLTLIR